MNSAAPPIPAHRYYDEPLGRLPWLIPAALLITAAALLGFLHLLAMKPQQPHSPNAIAVQVIELPPEPQPAPPQPVVAPPVQETPPVPTPEPRPQPQPKRAVVPPRPAPPQPQAQPPQSTAPVPQQQNAPPPGNMGARALYQPMPEIPEALRRSKLDLVAVARFHVAANGTATVELVQPTPEPTLNTALLEALKRWRFFPAMENSRPIDSTVDIRIPISVR